jgi:rhodanese-related sulfurtransferase
MLNRAMSFAAAFVAAIVLLFPGPVLAQTAPPAVGELLARTKAQVKTIDMAAFKAGLEKGELGMVVDVREPEEFEEGHVAGAINIPRGVIEVRIWPKVGFPDKLDLGKKITLYCGTGFRCVMSAKSLQDLGFTNVTAVDMKIADWKKAGYPLVAE